MSTPTIEQLVDSFIKQGGSDLYLTVDAKPSMRLEDDIIPLAEAPLRDEDIHAYLRTLFNEAQLKEFNSTLELNAGLHWKNTARLRLNAFMQRQHPGIVIRHIITSIPTPESLKLPKAYTELVMEQRGLVLVVGPTGSGKSTSLASMIGHRNRHGSGHIVTIEDPIEFIHEHQGCIVTQRDVGIDTLSFPIALKNALRQRPDVILIGEIRDRDAMEQAIAFAETGHLCLATLHANNSNQAIERVLNFFPEEKHQQVLLNLSLNLRGILSQRLVHNLRNRRSLAVEVMLNQGVIRNLILEGKIFEIKDHIEKGHDVGMQSFDQSLLALFSEGVISAEVAVREADNPANMRLKFKQRDVHAKLTAPGITQQNPF